jgi:hypothetical protein
MARFSTLLPPFVVPGPQHISIQRFGETLASQQIHVAPPPLERLVVRRNGLNEVFADSGRLVYLVRGENAYGTQYVDSINVTAKVTRMESSDEHALQTSCTLSSTTFWCLLEVAIPLQWFSATDSRMVSVEFTHTAKDDVIVDTDGSSQAVLLPHTLAATSPQPDGVYALLPFEAISPGEETEIKIFLRTSSQRGSSTALLASISFGASASLLEARPAPGWATRIVKSDNGDRTALAAFGPSPSELTGNGDASSARYSLGTLIATVRISIDQSVDDSVAVRIATHEVVSGSAALQDPDQTFIIDRDGIIASTADAEDRAAVGQIYVEQAQPQHAWILFPSPALLNLAPLTGAPSAVAMTVMTLDTQGKVGRLVATPRCSVLDTGNGRVDSDCSHIRFAGTELAGGQLIISVVAGEASPAFSRPWILFPSKTTLDAGLRELNAVNGWQNPAGGCSDIAQMAELRLTSTFLLPDATTLALDVSRQLARHITVSPANRATLLTKVNNVPVAILQPRQPGEVALQFEASQSRLSAQTVIVVGEARVSLDEIQPFAYAIGRLSSLSQSIVVGKDTAIGVQLSATWTQTAHQVTPLFAVGRLSDGTLQDIGLWLGVFGMVYEGQMAPTAHVTAAGGVRAMDVAFSGHALAGLAATGPLGTVVLELQGSQACGNLVLGRAEMAVSYMASPAIRLSVALAEDVQPPRLMHESHKATLDAICGSDTPLAMSFTLQAALHFQDGTTVDVTADPRLGVTEIAQNGGPLLQFGRDNGTLLVKAPSLSAHGDSSLHFTWEGASTLGTSINVTVVAPSGLSPRAQPFFPYKGSEGVSFTQLHRLEQGEGMPVEVKVYLELSNGQSDVFLCADTASLDTELTIGSARVDFLLDMMTHGRPAWLLRPTMSGNGGPVSVQFTLSSLTGRLSLVVSDQPTELKELRNVRLVALSTANEYQIAYDTVLSSDGEGMPDTLLVVPASAWLFSPELGIQQPRAIRFTAAGPPPAAYTLDEITGRIQVISNFYEPLQVALVSQMTPTTVYDTLEVPLNVEAPAGVIDLGRATGIPLAPVNVGEAFLVEVRLPLRAQDSVGFWQFRLTYDSTLLSFAGLEVGNAGCQNGILTHHATAENLVVLGYCEPGARNAEASDWTLAGVTFAALRDGTGSIGATLDVSTAEWEGENRARVSWRRLPLFLL